MNLIFKTPYFDLCEENDFYFVNYPSEQVVVLAYFEKKILLIKQYRTLLGEDTYELPAGSANIGENIKVAARRELEEETGIFIEDLSRFVFHQTMVICPNRIKNKSTIFKVNLSSFECDKVKTPLHSEVDEAKLYDLLEVKEMLSKNIINISLPKAVILEHIYFDRQ